MKKLTRNLIDEDSSQCLKILSEYTGKYGAHYCYCAYFLRMHKHDITLMSSLQVLQNKAAKVILNRPLYSSSTEALAVL